MDNPHYTDEQAQQAGKSEVHSNRSPRSVFRLALNGLIVSLLVLVGFFGYSYLSHSTAKPVPSARDSVVAVPSHGIQLDVLNGCGVKGTAVKFTNFLRTNGFDVVEMKNYKSSHIPHTLVVDRVGNLANARRVAAVLGVSGENVIQQLSPDYFVDVSVIIGDDFARTKPIH